MTQARATRKTIVMHPETLKYNESLTPLDRHICNLLAAQIDQS